MVQHFLSILSFNPHTNLIMWVFVLAQFHEWETFSSARLRFTQLHTAISARGGVSPEAPIHTIE